MDEYIPDDQEGQDAIAPPPSTDSARGTLVLDQGMVKAVRSAINGGVDTGIVISVASYRSDGIFFVTDEVCPLTGTRQTPYSASGATLTFHTTVARREVYTRRP